MGILELIEGIIDLICSWRFYLCLAAGALLVWATLHFIPYEPVAWVLSACIFIAAFVVGWRWDGSSSR